MDHAQIALLPAEVSRRIAAGEVIEKPASVVRELLDNALDAKADAVDVTWEDGGSELIRVHDNGSGMTRDDLELCWKPHATSKIRTLEDLDHARSLGFRGEALASIAAVSELTIDSTLRGADTGHRLTVHHADDALVEPAPPRTGTSVSVRRLFANLPARRRFLSRSSAESRVIRNTILEKALPFPEVRFSFPGTGGTPQVLPEQSLLERTAQVLGGACPAQNLTELHGTGEGFACTIIAAHPEVVRRDRRLIQIYINRRRVSEYKLVQAVEYAYQDVQHGGVFPIAAVLIDVDPELADFNIHPAKREVRLRNAGEIHHRIVTLLRSHLRTYAVRAAVWETERTAPGELWERTGPGRSGDDGGYSRRSPGGDGPRHIDRSQHVGKPQHAESRESSVENRSRVGHASSFEHTRRAVPETSPTSASNTDRLTFLGTIFETFNLVERGDRLYIIDQHAVHERLLYDRLLQNRTSQSLLVPEEFETTPDQDRLLQQHRENYRDLGVVLDRVGPGRWTLTAIPTEYRSPLEPLIETILEMGGLQDAFDRRFLAEIACKAALKAGDYLDQLTGEELARRALALPEPRCPHGRPLWIELDRERLEQLIGRK